jgi:hypothetical protein
MGMNTCWVLWSLERLGCAVITPTIKFKVWLVNLSAIYQGTESKFLLYSVNAEFKFLLLLILSNPDELFSFLAKVIVGSYDSDSGFPY